ncbi:PaaI family thioesterase [Maribacter spongiicola]|uniref:PaaI family thioesterase n=1 Tax=Maribacter spongiicola TaxID=1206753 RepID=UPI003F9BF78B
MSVYQKVEALASKVFKKNTIFRYGFNLSPMYKRSTAKLIEVSEDLLHVKIIVPLSYKNKNYVNSIFGGSMFSAVDPIPMIQLLSIMGNDYVVWDKSAEIFFKKPAKENLYADFDFSENELAEIRAQVAEKKEIDIIKITQLTNKEKSQVFCEVRKTIYIADKAYFKQKRQKKTGI